MADTAVPEQKYADPAPVAHDGEQYVQHTPVWVVVLRALQMLFAIIILIMAGVLIHGHAMGANAFAVVCWLFTWIVVIYVLVAEKVPSARKAYNIWAVLALDGLMALFWMACLGANAALRATFTDPVKVEACFNDGSAISSNHCIVSRREIAKRAAVAGPVGLALMSAIAGLSALVWLLFVATLVFHGHTYRLWRQEHKTPSADNATVEMKAQGTPMLGAQATPQPVHPQYTDQQQYQSQMYPPHQQPAPAAYPAHPDAYAQQQQPMQQQPVQYHDPAAQAQPQGYAAFPDPAQYQPQQQQQQQQPYSPHGTPAPGQQAYSPHGTPAPGQPYYPPQQ